MIEDLAKIARSKHGVIYLILILAIIISLLAYEFLPSKKQSYSNSQDCSPSIANSTSQGSITINNNCSASQDKKHNE